MEDFELMRIVDVEYLHDYVMKLEFSNGECRIVNFDSLLHGKFLDELRDKKKFIQFALTPWTLEWYNGVDFAPEYLYEHSVPVDSTIPGHADYAAEDRAPYNEK